MQNMSTIADSTTLAASLAAILNNDKTALSCSSGTAFPTAELQVGMWCLRTDQAKLYMLKDATPTWLLMFDLSKDFSAWLAAKLDAGSYTAADVLAKLLTVDGSGSALDADMVDGYHAGNANGNIPVSNGTVNTNLNADKLDGYDAGNASGNVPVSNGTVSTNLNADMVDGKHAPNGAIVGTTDAQTLSNKTMAAPVLTGPVENKVAMAANAIDLTTGTVFVKTISAATTFTISGVGAAGFVSSFVLDLTNGGAFTITWWATIKWAGGTAPTLTAPGRDLLGFMTHDGGTTWTGFVLGKDVK